MRLYSSPNSPFGARLLIASRAKGIEIEAEVLPCGGLRSDEFLSINPIAKIPVIQTDEGRFLPESETILRYLEARYPAPSLYPAGADACGRIDLAARVMDLYVMGPVIRLFPHLDPSRRDQLQVKQEVSRWREGLAWLADFLRQPLPKTPAGVSLADCVMAPSFHLGTRISAMLGLNDDPISSHRELVDYYRLMASHSIVGPVLEMLTAAQEEKDLQAGLPSLAAYHRKLAS